MDSVLSAPPSRGGKGGFAPPRRSKIGLPPLARRARGGRGSGGEGAEGLEGKGRGGWCEVVREGVGRRGSVRGGVGSRMAGGEGGFGAQKDIIVLYYQPYLLDYCPPLVSGPAKTRGAITLRSQNMRSRLGGF